jgi:hypothetical protein
MLLGFAPPECRKVERLRLAALLALDQCLTKPDDRVAFHIGIFEQLRREPLSPQPQ